MNFTTVAVLAVTVAVVAAGCAGLADAPPDASPGHDEDDDHPAPRGRRQGIDRYGLWSVGADPVVEPVWAARGVIDVDHRRDVLWMNWTVTGDGGDVRWTTWPPGCSDADCAVVDDTRDGPAVQNFSDPEPGKWEWRVISLTPTVDPYQVDAVRYSVYVFRHDAAAR